MILSKVFLPINKELSKWIITIKMAWSNMAVYKMAFLSMFILPSLVFFFVKYNLWSSIYTLNEIESLKGYSWEQMLQYQLWILVVSLFSSYRYSGEMSVEIRLGGLSKYLLRPFSFWKAYTSIILASLAVNFIIIMITIMTALYFNVIPDLKLE